ncbi:unnamed protein product [Effrenium voratum]|nr:unnamed protein product [Effrenium voratum]
MDGRPIAMPPGAGFSVLQLRDRAIPAAVPDMLPRHQAEFWSFLPRNDHIIRPGSGWSHALCPEAARGVLMPVEPVEDDGVGPGEHAPGPLVPSKRVLSWEQKAVVHYPLAKGSKLRVSAVAGAGKTTTCVKLAERILKDSPDTKILYVVFNEKAKEEAVARFPAQVAVKTSHAVSRSWAWRCPKHVEKGIKLDEVVEHFELLNPTEERWGLLASADSAAAKRKAKRELQKRARTEARFVVKTLENFLWSDAEKVQDEHIFWKARVAATSKKQATFEVPPLAPEFYRQKAQRIYDQMQDEEAPFPQTHDGYMKRFQLMRPDLGAPPCGTPGCAERGAAMRPRSGRFGRFWKCQGCGATGSGYDVVIIDEAHCQAAAFWQQDAAVYLVGDARQRIYRWRGASEDFERCSVEKELTLCETWRFGPAIAEVTNAVLSCCSGDQTVIGRNPDPGAVLWPGRPGAQAGEESRAPKGPKVIITRSNKGMLDELQDQIAESESESLPTWAFIDEKMASLSRPKTYETFLKLNQGEPLTYHGEEFDTWEELKQYAEDEGDTQLANKIEVIEKWGARLPDFLAQIEASRVESWKEADLGLITAHKAKGLEFAYVMLGSDFKLPMEEEADFGNWKLLPEYRLRRPHWQEELNVLYVAISRAQRFLRLSLEAAQFLALLGQQPRPRTSSAAKSSEDGAELAALRAGDEVRWANFEREALRTDSELVVQEETVPWPRGGDENVLSLHEDLTQEEVQRLLQQALLRFHPDKFSANPKWRARIPQRQLEAGSRLQQRLALTTRAILQLKRDWTAQEGEECVICYEFPRRSLRLRTTCCGQVLCRPCHAKNLARPAASCPMCRAQRYVATPHRGRSRSPRRAIA